jgi:hypothetical protein
MRTKGLLVLIAAALASAILPLLADEPAPGKPAATGKDDMAQTIKTATTRHVEILTGLLSKVPESARGTLEKAIAAAGEEGDKAIAALSGQAGAGPGAADSAKSKDSTKTGPPAKPAVTGLQAARAVVADGFEKSADTLKGLVGRVPPEAESSIEAALGRLRNARVAALQKLDSGIAAGRPPQHAPQHQAKPASAPPPQKPPQR